MSSGKRRAIIIGIDRYDDSSFNALPYAREDAEAVHRVLTDPEIGDFSREDSVLIVPEDNAVITKADVERKIEEIFLKADKTDTVLVYFAGHGKLDTSLKLRLAAQNTSIERLVSTSISMETIREIIANSACRRAVFMIDSCYSGAAGLSARSSDAVITSLEQMSEDGVVVISSCQAFQEALEKDDIKKGIFTDIFIKGLEGEELDSDGDGNISLDEIWNYLETNVKTETKGRQVPAKIGRIEGPVHIAKSSKFLRDQREQIEKYLFIAEERLAEKIKDKAFDAYRNVLKLDPKNSQALKGITDLIDDTKKGLSEYQIDYQTIEKIESNIYDEATKVLDRTYLSLTAVQQGCVRLIMTLLINRNLETFEKNWKMLINREQPLEQQEKDKLKREEEARQLRVVGQYRESEKSKAPEPQSPTTAKVEPKPVAPAQASPGEQRAAKPVQVFVSYAREDKKSLDALKKMIRPLITNDTISWWDDSMIPEGADWLAEIRKQLDTVDIALLLLSQDFFNSDFIKREEMPTLIEVAENRGVKFLSVLVGKCLWKEEKAIRIRQFLYSGVPLNRLSASELEDALEVISNGIKKVAQTVVAQRTQGAAVEPEKAAQRATTQSTTT